MIVVRDLDSRRRIVTFSEGMAREYWRAIVAAGGTPHATHREFGISRRLVLA